MKNLGKKLLSMGLMLAMAFNCANIGKCLGLIGEDEEVKLARENNERSVFGRFLPEEQKEILNLIVYAGLIERSEVVDRDSLEKDMFGRVLSENERLGKLYYLEGLKAQYGSKLLELLGVQKEVRDIIKANNFKKVGPQSAPKSMKAEKCGYAAQKRDLGDEL